MAFETIASGIKGNIIMIDNSEKHNFALSVLKLNKDRFTKIQFGALMTIAINPFDYRKKYEEGDYRIPYLPSFRQQIEDKLAAIGLEIRSIPANDGTARKRYSIRPVKR